MVLQGESNQLYESLSASSVRLSLGDFFIKGNPNDVNKLRNACESILVFSLFQKNKGKVLLLILLNSLIELTEDIHAL